MTETQRERDTDTQRDKQMYTEIYTHRCRHRDIQCTMTLSISPQRPPTDPRRPSPACHPYYHRSPPATQMPGATCPNISVLGFDPDLLRANALHNEEACVVDTESGQPPVARIGILGPLPASCKTRSRNVTSLSLFPHLQGRKRR